MSVFPPRAMAAAASGVVAAVLTVTACTTVVDGAAQRPAGEPDPSGVDLSLLDTGNYPTRPAPPLGTAGSAQKGGLVEAVRMADHVVGPWQVVTVLSEWVMPTTIIKDAAALPLLLPERIAAAADKHNFITGFSSARRTEPDRASLVNAVLRFADPPSAAAAAAEFADLALQPGIADYLPQAQPVPVPNHPDTRASTYETTPPGSTGPETNVNAYTARGPFVLIQSAETPDGVGPTADVVAKTLDQQIPAIDKFTPTAVPELANLALDETGLLASTIPDAGDRVPVGTNFIYQRHAALHYQSLTLSATELFSDAGMDLWSRGKASVYRARDPESATRMLEQFAAEAVEDGDAPAAAVPNLPDSQCFQRDERLGTYVVCFVVADRNLVEAPSAQLTDAHQLAAAQFTMLMSA